MPKQNKIYLNTRDGKQIKITETQAKRFEASPFYVCRKNSAGQVTEVRSIGKMEKAAKSRYLHFKETLTYGKPFAIRHPDGRQAA